MFAVRRSTVWAAGLIAVSTVAPGSPSVLADASDTVLAVPGRTNATPSVASAGNVVAVAWGGRTPAGATDVFVAMSRDAGGTFGAPVQVNTRPGEARLGGEMPPRVSIRRAAGGTAQVTVLWTAKAEGRTEIRLARSIDEGRTFAAPVTLQQAGAAGDRGWPALALDASGAPHAVWLDHRGLAEKTETSPHAGHDPSATMPAERDGVVAAQKSGLYYAGGAAGGERELAKGVCYCCKTAVAAGAANTIFMAWRHVYPGNIRDIAFLQSRDGGGTFGTPVRVSEDGWQLDGCPDDGPAMAVDSDNSVHLVWPTVVGGANPQGGLFYTSTRDGRTFTARQRVPTLGSPKPSHPQIVMDSNDDVVIAWDEVRNGVRTAVLLLVLVAPDGTAAFGPPQILGAGGVPSVYPVLATGPKGVIAAWTSGPPDRASIVVRRIENPSAMPR